MYLALDFKAGGVDVVISNRGSVLFAALNTFIHEEVEQDSHCCTSHSLVVIGS